MKKILCVCVFFSSIFGNSIWFSEIGDMLKRIYDTNNNGIVDQAENINFTATNVEYAALAGLASNAIEAQWSESNNYSVYASSAGNALSLSGLTTTDLSNIFLLLSGGTMSGDINLGDNYLTNVGKIYSAANGFYLSNTVASFLNNGIIFNSAGLTLTVVGGGWYPDFIDADGYITNVDKIYIENLAQTPNEAVTKLYVDDGIGKIFSNITTNQSPFVFTDSDSIDYLASHTTLGDISVYLPIASNNLAREISVFVHCPSNFTHVFSQNGDLICGFTNFIIGPSRSATFVSDGGGIWFTKSRSESIRANIYDALASSETGNIASNTFDKNYATRWESDASDPQWVWWDLGSELPVSKIRIFWEGTSAATYELQGSHDTNTWTTVTTVTNAVAGPVDIESVFVGVYRYIRMNGLTRTTGFGYSIWESEIYIY